MEKHLSKTELQSHIKEKRREVRLLERLLFIKYLYNGDSVPEACEHLEIAKATGYDWLDRWNAGGLDGLTPNFGGGRPPKLTPEQLDELQETLHVQAHWTTKEVHQHIKDTYGVDYSERNVYKLL